MDKGPCLFRSQMSDLQEVTHNVHYENFRSERLLNGKISEKEKEHERNLREKEAELKRMEEKIARMTAQMNQQARQPHLI